MKLDTLKQFRVCIADEGKMFKAKNDDAEIPYLFKIAYLPKSITTIEQCKEIWEEVDEVIETEEA